PNEFFGYTKVTVEQPLIEDGEVKLDNKGKPKADKSKSDYENIQLSKDINQYFDEEVKPNAPNAWCDRSKDKVGYQITFTKYFYKFVEFRSIEKISNDLKSLNEEINKLTEEIND
ncbi:SAM-dependent DNA methyltransferase, partial [Acidimicrobiia bacterium]|nr:SAM-dependent DNA methyltransferase [Acidimicrobiia bacterium]